MEQVSTSGSRDNLVPQKQSLTPRMVLAVSTATLGMFNFGYNTGVTNAPQTVIESFYNETNLERTGTAISSGTLSLLWGFTVAIFAVGGLIGGLMGGWYADKLGRKLGMQLNCLLGLVAAAFMGFSGLASSYEMLIIGRLLVGINCGLYTGLTPMYNAEVSPANIRGAVGTVNQLGVTLALLCSQVLGLSQVLGSQTLWPVLLGLTALPPLLQLLLLPLCPESPRYLLINLSKQREATTALMQLRGASDACEVQEEIEEMLREQHAEQMEEKVSLKQMIKARWLRAPLLISILMHMSQQFSGINCIFYYSTGLFKDAGLAPGQAQYATLGVGAIMVVMTLISIPLMDVAGRKTLHLIGLAGMFVFSIVFTVSFRLAENSKPGLEYLSIASALLIVVFFAVGPGSIPWMIVAELFTQGPRSIAISICVAINWLCNFIVGQSFPPLQKSLKTLVFLPYTCLVLLFFVTLLFVLPETKNISIEAISNMFRPADRHVQDYSFEDENSAAREDQTKNNLYQGYNKSTRM